MSLLYSVNQSLSLSLSLLRTFLLLYSLTTTKSPVALYIDGKKNNPENSRTTSRKKRKKSPISYLTLKRLSVSPTTITYVGR